MNPFNFLNSQKPVRGNRSNVFPLEVRGGLRSIHYLGRNSRGFNESRA